MIEVEGGKQQDLIQFIKLVQEVAELPEEQRKKVVYFAQGVIAATERKVAIINE